MDKLLRSISYIFHPLIMPLLGVVFYFWKTPRYIAPEIIQGKLISIFILTVLLPIPLFYILKIFGKIKSIHLKTTKERIYPLLFNSVIIFHVLSHILTPSQSIELYYFFVGVLISNLACLLLAIMKFKASIHLIGVSGVFMFFVALSIHFSINIIGTLALMSIIIGAVATSRLHSNAHDFKELIMGLFIGAMPQLILVNYWL